MEVGYSGGGYKNFPIFRISSVNDSAFPAVLPTSVPGKPPALTMVVYSPGCGNVTAINPTERRRSFFCVYCRGLPVLDAATTSANRAKSGVKLCKIGTV